MSKITPQQAFEAAKTLWPDATHIATEEGMTAIHFSESLSITAKIGANLDWPEGVTQWPMPEKKYRDARMPEDYGKPAWFRDVDGPGIWYGNGRTLCGLIEHVTHYRWIDSLGTAWKFCQVIDEPPVTFADVVAALAIPTIDPGKGYRLIDPNVDKPQEGDEFWYAVNKRWHTRAGDPTLPWIEGETYRRKIKA